MSRSDPALLEHVPGIGDGRLPVIRRVLLEPARLGHDGRIRRGTGGEDLAADIDQRGLQAAGADIMGDDVLHEALGVGDARVPSHAGP